MAAATASSDVTKSDDQESCKSNSESLDDGESLKGGHGGYAYWKRAIPDSHLLPPCTPQKIETPITPCSLPTAGMSAWNASGTWEERSVGPKASTTLEKLLKEKRFSVDMDGEAIGFVITRGSTTQCDATICYVRGKARFGYDVSLTGAWQTTRGEGSKHRPLKGTFSVHDLTDHDDDVEVTMSTLSRSTSDDEDSDSDNEASGHEASSPDEAGHTAIVWTAALRHKAQRQLAALLKTMMRDIGQHLATPSSKDTINFS